MPDFKKQISRVYGIGVYQLVLACLVILLAVIALLGLIISVFSGGGGNIYGGVMAAFGLIVVIVLVLVIAPLFIVSAVLKIISFVKSLKSKRNLNIAPDLAVKQMYSSSLFALIGGIYDICFMFVFSLLFAIYSTEYGELFLGIILAFLAFITTLGMAVPNLIVFISTVKTKKLRQG